LENKKEILQHSSLTSSSSIVRDIQAALDATADARGVFGSRFHYDDEVGSTNDLAMRAAERGEPEGAVFVAGAQTAGRGRLGRTWFSPPGAGLYVSTIVRRPALAPWITLAGGVAVAEGIRAATGLPVEIKWPNDVVAVGSAGFRARRKLAGILAEAVSDGRQMQHVVLGYGINLLTSAFPPELAHRATSIESELGRLVEAGPVLAQTLVALNRVTSEIETAGPSAFLRRWLGLAPSVTGARIEWNGADGAPLSGVTAGLASDGALLARTPAGIERILSGEIRWV
jgi:BirA family transcriptional regulator, biotin operon repressor / biotin---[acetyl-CoA-carboxylase] ligase